MASSAKDIQLRELKDTVSQRKTMIIFPVSSFSAPFQSVNGICKRSSKDFKS